MNDSDVETVLSIRYLEISAIRTLLSALFGNAWSVKVGINANFPLWLLLMYDYAANT